MGERRSLLIAIGVSPLPSRLIATDFFRFLEQLHQLIFPQRGKCVAAVAARFVARRNHDRASLRDALDLALENAELGRIDQVVGGIDGEKRRTDFFQIRSRIVIM